MTESEEKAKAWLNRNYGESIYINSLRRRLERLESEIDRMTKPLSRRESQVNHDDNSQENKLTEYLDFLDELKNKEIILFNHDLETVNVIDKVESYVFRTILTESGAADTVRKSIAALSACASTALHPLPDNLWRGLLDTLVEQMLIRSV